MKGLLPFTALMLGMSFANSVSSQLHEQHSSKHLHSTSAVQSTMESLPGEGGQSAFTAMSEIISMLERDPSTDWATVQIDVLREHLVDMHLLMLDTRVDTEILDDTSIRFRVSGQGRAVNAIHRMVPSHASAVRDSTGWFIDVARDPAGVTLMINPRDEKAFTKLRALGFYGFMSIGAHHQAHHFQMAKGEKH